MTDFRSTRVAWGAALLVVCLLHTSACKKRETPSLARPTVRELQEARWIEPRLTFSSAWKECTKSRREGHVLETPDCGGPYQSKSDVSPPYEVCERNMISHAKTVQWLITVPACTDAAIDRLTDLAGAQTKLGNKDEAARITTDLAAAYYYRAQKDDRLSDLLQSLHAARKAVHDAPRFPAAQFNLALAQQALGFAREARATWSLTATLDRSPWATEALTRREAMEKQDAVARAFDWSLNKTRLPEAVLVGDRAAVLQLVQPYPAAAQRFAEEEILPAWALAMEENRGTAAQQRLREATAIAEALLNITSDPYMRDVVRCISGARGETLRSLIQGHKLFGEARSSDHALKRTAAIDLYARAAPHLGRAHSPLRLGAELGIAVQRMRYEANNPQPRQKLDELEPEARARGYSNLSGRLQSNRANLLHTEGRYLDAVDLYDRALATFQSMHDEENQANVHMRKAGTLRILGNEEAALREIFLANRFAGKLEDITSRHLLAGETAATALALAFPEIAFDYQSAFIDLLQEETAKAAGDPTKLEGLRLNRAIALRKRAEIWVQLGRLDRATAELDEASSISKGQSDDIMRNGLSARIAEVRGQAAMPAHPEVAIEAFTDALAHSKPVGYRTLETILLTQRAKAHRQAGHKKEATDDLTTAIVLLNEEERELLQPNLRGKNEAIWRGYFSRFQESYQLLIEQLLEDDRKEEVDRKKEAFVYAEKSRAYEPLKLVRELSLPKDAVGEIGKPSDPKVPEIQSALPAGTFLLEFQVGEKKTFVWILSHDDFDMLTLPFGRAAITEWIRALHRSAVNGNGPVFERGLSAPYAGLFAEALAKIARMKNGTMPERSLVIVPDRFTHGLPFAALRNANARYLIQDFAISVSASAELYVAALERNAKFVAARADAAPKTLHVGDPAFDESLDLARGLGRLRNARNEAEQGAAIYGRNAKVLVEQDATVAAFLEHAKDSVVIDFAGHAISNRQAPFGALLLMAPGKGNNGLLYAEELLNKLRLDKARLVVLGACSSAGGVPVGPEGLAPLVRPIVGAGVPAVVGTLWTINDSPSRRVLLDFHRHFRNGQDAARAMQLAQVGLLEEGNVAIPVMAWAPFQVIGQASSPFPRIDN